MRTYSVAVASLAIDAPAKWTDNLLSHHQITDVVIGQHGVARRISHRALLRLALVRELHTRLGMGVRDAVAAAARLGQDDDREQPSVAFGALGLSLNRAALISAVEQRLRDALETAPQVRRGRRPRVARSS